MRYGTADSMGQVVDELNKREALERLTAVRAEARILSNTVLRIDAKPIKADDVNRLRIMCAYIEKANAIALDMIHGWPTDTNYEDLQNMTYEEFARMLLSIGDSLASVFGNGSD